jgi:hypothetical protein
MILLTLGFVWVVSVDSGMALTGTAAGAAWVSGISATEGAILLKRMDAAVVLFF